MNNIKHALSSKPTTFAIILIAFSILFFASMQARAVGDEMPNYTSLDKEILVVICQKQYQQIRDLKAEISVLQHKQSEPVQCTARITSISIIDTSRLKTSLTFDRKNMAGFEKQKRTAEMQLADMQKRGEFHNLHNPEGYRHFEMKNAELEIYRVDRQLARCEESIKKLEAQINKAQVGPIITATMENNEPIEIIFLKKLHGDAEKLRIGHQYEFEGYFDGNRFNTIFTPSYVGR